MKNKRPTRARTLPLMLAPIAGNHSRSGGTARPDPGFQACSRVAVFTRSNRQPSEVIKRAVIKSDARAGIETSAQEVPEFPPYHCDRRCCTVVPQHVATTSMSPDVRGHQ